VLKDKRRRGIEQIGLLQQRVKDRQPIAHGLADQIRHLLWINQLSPLNLDYDVVMIRLGKIFVFVGYRLPMSPPFASSQPSVETPVLPGGLLFGYRCDMTGDQLPIVGLPAWL
jgi:hypothetical protein